jgi:hypothetical protein
MGEDATAGIIAQGILACAQTFCLAREFSPKAGGESAPRVQELSTMSPKEHHGAVDLLMTLEPAGDDGDQDIHDHERSSVWRQGRHRIAQ